MSPAIALEIDDVRRLGEIGVEIERRARSAGGRLEPKQQESEARILARDLRLAAKHHTVVMERALPVEAKRDGRGGKLGMAGDTRPWHAMSFQRELILRAAGDA